LTVKRGGGGRNLQFGEAINFSQDQAADLVALDDALTALAKFDERKARVIELRYFGEVSVEQVADMLGVSVATIGRESRVAHWNWRLADSYTGLANLHESLAANPKTSMAERGAHRGESCVWRRKALEVWDSWNQYGVSSSFNTAPANRPRTPSPNATLR